MGGPKSGRWYYHKKRRTVEDCLTLHAHLFLRKDSSITPGVKWQGSWQPPNVPENQHPTADFKISHEQTETILEISYSFVGNESEVINQFIRLKYTEPQFGGRRWWFICPLMRNGEPCNRKVRMLHLPPGRNHFGCRICHQLTYKSCQKQSETADQSLKMDQTNPWPSIRGRKHRWS